jgi:hypothetical protein
MSMVKVKFSGDCIGIFKGRSWFCTNHYCPKRGSKGSWLGVFLLCLYIFICFGRGNFLSKYFFIGTNLLSKYILGSNFFFAFIAFAFDNFGFLVPDVADLLHRVQKIINNNVVFPMSMDVVFKRIGFVIEKGLAA